MRYTFLLLSLIIGLDLFAQTKTDSLLKVIKNQPTNYNAQIDYAGSIYTSEPDSALFIIRNCISKKLNTEGLALAYKYIGNIYRFTNKIDSSCFYFRKSINYANQIQDNSKRNDALAITLINYANSLVPINKLKNARDTLLLALKLTNNLDDTLKKYKLKGVAELNLSQVHTAMGLYDFALQNLNNAIKYLESINIQTYNTPIYMGFGGIKSRLGLFSEAILYKQQAIIECKKNNDNINVVYALQNISQDYLKLNLLDSASYFNKASLDYYIKFLNDNQYEPYYQQQGAIEFLRKDYNQSIQFHLKAIEIAKADNDALKIAENQFLMGKNYVALNKINIAKDMFLQAMLYYEKNNDAVELKEIYLELAQIEKQLNNLNQSIFYRTKYDSISNIINKEERINAIAAQEIRFETTQKNKIIDTQITKIKNSRYFNFILIGLLLFFLALSFIIYTYFKKQTQHAKLETRHLALQLDEIWKKYEQLYENKSTEINNADNIVENEVSNNLEKDIHEKKEIITEQNHTENNSYIEFRENREIKRIKYAAIYYIKGEKNYQEFFDKNDKRIGIILLPLVELHQRLPKYLCRVQKSYIININYLSDKKRIKEGKKEFVVLINGKKIPYSDKYDEIEDKLLQ